MSRMLRNTVLIKSEEERKEEEEAKEAERLKMESKKRQEALEAGMEDVEVAEDKGPNSKVLEQYVGVEPEVFHFPRGYIDALIVVVGPDDS
jgi:hypothetical protein